MDLEMVMTGMAVEAAIEGMANISRLVQKYSATGVDVVPIKELKQAMHKGFKAALSEDSLTQKLMKKGN